MKPIIGINLDIEQGPPPKVSLQTTYIQAITKSGGTPLLLTPVPDHDLSIILDQLHGLVLVGGNDYHPSLYGEPVDDQVVLIDPMRQEFDLRLVKQALNKRELPILAICGGLQLLNISLGGSLIQDIPKAIPESKVEHTNPVGSLDGWRSGFHKHLVKIEPGTKLANIYGLTQLAVPSSHHQSIKQLGAGLRATAYALDGVIEAVELDDSFFTVAVQWHPERDFAANKSLFDAFISNCAREMAREGNLK